MTDTRAVDARRHGRGEVIAFSLAVVFGALLLVAALVVPVYQSTTSSSSGVTDQTATLVEENGSWALLVTGVPLLITFAVIGVVWSRGGRRRAGLVAWVLVGLLGIFNFLAMLSIGPVVIPVTVCLIVGCALHGSRTDRGSK